MLILVKRKVKMPDDNQSTTPATSDPSDTSVGQLDQAAEQAANEALEKSASGAEQDLSANIPALSDIEYATPSAYIDPDLPAYDPNATLEPEEPEEETKEEETLELTPEQIAEAIKASHAVMAKVAEKIAASRNILIALSSDPSVDELASAISLSLFLDRLGKHAIAIYSGTLPNALNFLNPDGIFEKTADVLQDFVIAINKDKADHLRYKLDGDFVKVLITPYKDRITSEDLEFSYGDYNVDLVLSLNVNNGLDLDPALREYGTIMHDAAVVNITTGNPGKFGEIEWSNRFASSVSEMIADLFCNASGDAKLNPEEATALLAGIVASTDRFARANTASATMQISSQLLDFGANPELVAENITDDVDNQFFSFSDLKAGDSEEEKKDKDADSEISLESTEPTKEKSSQDDSTTLTISHDGEGEETPSDIEFSPNEKSNESSETNETNEADKTNEASESEQADSDKNSPEPIPTIQRYQEPKISTDSSEIAQADEPATGNESLTSSSTAEDPSLLDELKATEASLSGVGAETAPTPTNAPVQLNPQSLEQAAMSNISSASPTPTGASMESILPPVINPAASVTPNISTTPEVSSMPEINYGQSIEGQVLPPPPAPPVDINSPMPLPTIPTAPAAPSPVITPTTPTTPPAPDAFTIPGV